MRGLSLAVPVPITLGSMEGKRTQPRSPFAPGGLAGRLQHAGTLVALFACCAAILSGSAAGLTRVVGGNAIQIQAAPWTVFIQNTGSVEYDLCSGAIIDPLHILTAAHCVFDSQGTLAQPGQLTVKAGISNWSAPLGSDAEQDRGVSSFTVHPGYSYSTTPGPDDVAVIALSSPLDLSGAAAKAVALPTSAAPYPVGQTVTLAGFGEETSGTAPSGQLNALTATVEPQGNCGGDSGVLDDATRFCAASASSSSCEGDSGGGLVTSGSTPTLLGVLSAGAPDCPTGSASIYTDVSAPEILSFIQGDQTPPTAPREASANVELEWDRPLEVGSTLTCTTGSWASQATSFAYAFVDSANGQVLQRSARATFVTGSSDAGDRVSCTVLATNAGGTAAVSTTSTPPIAAGSGVAATPTETTATAGADGASGSSAPAGEVTAAEWNAETITAKAAAIPPATLGSGAWVAAPRWDGYLRLALLGDQNPNGPAYRDTYLRCWGAGWATAASAGATRFASAAATLGFYQGGSSWVNVPLETCQQGAAAAKGALAPANVEALGTILHETLVRQGLSDSQATCLGAVAVWHAVDTRTGASAANGALDALLGWYHRELAPASVQQLSGCAARLDQNWNG